MIMKVTGMAGDWGDDCSVQRSPTKEELLRIEYPDLKEKWLAYHEASREFLECENQLSAFTLFERIFNTKTYIFVWRKVEQKKKVQAKAFEDYEMLKKLLMDH